MGVNVNPRPQIHLPKALADLGIEVVNYFEQQSRFDLQMRERTGGDIDAVAESSAKSSNNFNSITQQLRKELNGLPEFTIDTTGFTFDSTEITFDKVIA